MLIALNRLLRRQQRRLAVAAVLCGLAGAVVAAHSVMGADHMSDGVAMCVAVAETALLAAGAMLVIGATRRSRERWLRLEMPVLPPAGWVKRVEPVARAGPPIFLAVLRL